MRTIESVSFNVMKASFIALPGEIRNRFYHFVFQPVTVLITIGDTKDNDIYNAPLFHCLSADDVTVGLSASINLSLVCKQICEEVRLLLYLNTTFVFDHTTAATVFLRRCRPEALASIQSIRIDRCLGNPRESEWSRMYIKDAEAAWAMVYRDMGVRLTGT